MSDLVENHIVGFLIMRLMYLSEGHYVLIPVCLVSMFGTVLLGHYTPPKTNKNFSVMFCVIQVPS